MSRETSQKPNVLLIMADQMTPFLMGAYGHQVVKTPNLDRLVEGGVRFDSAYSPCPLCAPARASMVTGKYVSNIEGRTRFSWLRPCYEVVTKNRNRGYAGMRDSVVSSRSGYDLVTLERNKVTTEAKSGIWILLLGNSAGYN